MFCFIRRNYKDYFTSVFKLNAEQLVTNHLFALQSILKKLLHVSEMFYSERCVFKTFLASLNSRSGKISNKIDTGEQDNPCLISLLVSLVR